MLEREVCVVTKGTSPDFIASFHALECLTGSSMQENAYYQRWFLSHCKRFDQHQQLAIICFSTNKNGKIKRVGMDTHANEKLQDQILSVPKTLSGSKFRATELCKI